MLESRGAMLEQPGSSLESCGCGSSLETGGASRRDARELESREAAYLEGITRWLGLRWFGIPYPRRLLAWWLYSDAESALEFCGRLPRCGCSVWLRALVRGVRAAVTGTDSAPSGTSSLS